ncbi:MAG: alpha/beta hydrolase [Acidimicrobiales bacterium]
MQLHIREEGSGDRTAVLIHGATGDGGTWFDTAPNLVSLGYRVLMPDLRGHGESPRAESYDLEEYAGDLVESLPRGVEIILGHSLGGRVLSLAIDRLLPDRAIYLDPGWTLPATVPEGITPTAADGSSMSEEHLRRINIKWSEAHIRQSLASYAKFDSRVLEFLPWGTTYLPSLPPAVPSLVILAGVGPSVSPAEQAQLGEAGYEIRTVNDSGHVVFADDLPGFFEAIDGWI